MIVGQIILYCGVGDSKLMVKHNIWYDAKSLETTVLSKFLALRVGNVASMFAYKA